MVAKRHGCHFLFLQKLRGQATLRHTFFNLPLLPSGPGGVRLNTVAQDLTSCGAEGIRTLDLSDANRTLSQLSYSPIKN